ncbi:helix-turn-helix domain-containing protein, partial [Acidisoma silvae]
AGGFHSEVRNLWLISHFALGRPAPMGTVYSHLTLDDRRIVFRLREAKLGISAIASRLGFHPSTTY